MGETRVDLLHLPRWLGLSPGGADRVIGLIEAPALAELELPEEDTITLDPRGVGRPGPPQPCTSVW